MKNKRLRTPVLQSMVNGTVKKINRQESHRVRGVSRCDGHVLLVFSAFRTETSKAPEPLGHQR